MTNRYTFLILLLIGACAPPKENMQETKGLTVAHAGALMSIMHEGDLSTQVQFDTLALDNLYALGALDSLSGELAIYDGTIYMSKVPGDSVVVDNDLATGAVLYVAAAVSEWESHHIQGDLDDALKNLAADLGFDGPFPFLLNGSFRQLDYHVINYDAATTDISNHKEGAWKESLSNQQVAIIGFYSDQHEGIFTHHGATTHMHVINEDKTTMGHIDKIELDTAHTYQILLPKL